MTHGRVTVAKLDAGGNAVLVEVPVAQHVARMGVFTDPKTLGDGDDATSHPWEKFCCMLLTIK
jgi:hypothetical protein